MKVILIAIFCISAINCMSKVPNIVQTFSQEQKDAFIAGINKYRENAANGELSYGANKTPTGKLNSVEWSNELEVQVKADNAANKCPYRRNYFSQALRYGNSEKLELDEVVFFFGIEQYIKYGGNFVKESDFANYRYRSRWQKLFATVVSQNLTQLAIAGHVEQDSTGKWYTLIHFSFNSIPNNKPLYPTGDADYNNINEELSIQFSEEEDQTATDSESTANSESDSESDQQTDNKQDGPATEANNNTLALKYHNEVRDIFSKGGMTQKLPNGSSGDTWEAARSPLPTMTLNANALKIAKNWKECSFKHTSSQQRTINGQYYGENMYFSTGSNFADVEKRATYAWYNEGYLSQAIDANIHIYQESKVKKPYTPVGHFSQVVWAKSTGLGCALHVCSSGIQGWVKRPAFKYTCNYFPGGNYRGAAIYVSKSDD